MLLSQSHLNLPAPPTMGLVRLPFAASPAVSTQACGAWILAFVGLCYPPLWLDYRCQRLLLFLINLLPRAVLWATDPSVSPAGCHCVFRLHLRNGFSPLLAPPLYRNSLGGGGGLVLFQKAGIGAGYSERSGLKIPVEVFYRGVKKAGLTPHGVGFGNLCC